MGVRNQKERADGMKAQADGPRETGTGGGAVGLYPHFVLYCVARGPHCRHAAQLGPGGGGGGSVVFWTRVWNLWISWVLRLGQDIAPTPTLALLLPDMDTPSSTPGIRRPSQLHLLYLMPIANPAATYLMTFSSLELCNYEVRLIGSV
ncbi:hypothetical protein CFIO01_09168 [Colletotrichum fioriniae PJ7]|uniref:Uncharacterized protein n=1 Tax=Colletotrichum fioriniae PJ7 TaxID=1445577 RepID=A0A010RQW4_9PEZI|nr:hypothetical protein CFIO01_09168 [Colletotrichum fioriniae PJ7]